MELQAQNDIRLKERQREKIILMSQKYKGRISAFVREIAEDPKTIQVNNDRLVKEVIDNDYRFKRSLGHSINYKIKSKEKLRKSFDVANTQRLRINPILRNDMTDSVTKSRNSLIPVTI